MPSTAARVGGPRRRDLTARLVETVRFYGPLGFSAFGGPSANLVLIRKIFVIDEKWIDDNTVQDLLALGNALPGPPFSQIAFSISALRGGILAAMLSFVLLTAPGMFAMIGIGYAVKKIPETLPDVVFALFTGLNSAAIGLVSLAAYQLSLKVISDKVTRLLVLTMGAIAVCYESQWLYPVLMVASGLCTFVVDKTIEYCKRDAQTMHWPVLGDTASSPAASAALGGSTHADDVERSIARPIPVVTRDLIEAETLHKRSVVTRRDSRESSDRYPTSPLEASSEFERGCASSASHPQSATEDDHSEDTAEFQEDVYFSMTTTQGLMVCAGFFALLITLIVLRAVLPSIRILDFTTNLTLTGTLIFGGGPVVVPLLRSYTVDPGWITPRDFLLGFALLQALPGPQFNFAAFLGVLVVPSQPFLGGLLGAAAIFAPGILLKLGALPLYQKWKTNASTRSVLRGLNAGAIGLIYSAVYCLFKVGFVQASKNDPSVSAMFQSLDRDGFWISVVAATFVACGWFNVATPVGILGGALSGLAWYGVQRA
ncbi:BQ2448_7942 [Microbotryum intermedium]|uniref:BQ2448_7942 protein n=1 Tax=Microbotryum intermedium TaxID=269621 RepID=A0A238FSH5_9BASI|nr:BQ2448_7942 [Microbotryum intermedium]